MGAWDGGWDGIWFVCVYVCVTNLHKKMYTLVWMWIPCVWGCVFVSLCLFVLKSVSVCVSVHECVCESGDAPSKSGPRQEVIHDFITQALHKAPSNTPPFLSAPLCFFPMLPLSFHVFPTAFLTLCFLCPRCCFTIHQPPPLSLFLSSCSHVWICTTFALISSQSRSALSPFPIVVSRSKIFYLVHSTPLCPLLTFSFHLTSLSLIFPSVSLIVLRQALNLTFEQSYLKSIHAHSWCTDLSI